MLRDQDRGNLDHLDQDLALAPMKRPPHTPVQKAAHSLFISNLIYQFFLLHLLFCFFFFLAFKHLFLKWKKGSQESSQNLQTSETIR